MNQKKTLEINPRHPLIKELQQRVELNPKDEVTIDLAQILLDTAKLRGGYFLDESSEFAGRIERMLRLSIGVDVNAPVSTEIYLIKPSVVSFVSNCNCVCILIFFHSNFFLSLPLSFQTEEEVFETPEEEEGEEEVTDDDKKEEEPDVEEKKEDVEEKREEEKTEEPEVSTKL